MLSFNQTEFVGCIFFVNYFETGNCEINNNTAYIIGGGLFVMLMFLFVHSSIF